MESEYDRRKKQEAEETWREIESIRLTNMQYIGPGTEDGTYIYENKAGLRYLYKPRKDGGADFTLITNQDENLNENNSV